MFFYDFNDLDNFINNTLIKALPDEHTRINGLISLYNDKKENILNITTNMIAATNNSNKNKVDDFHKTVSLLKQALESVETIINYSKVLKDNLDNLSTLSKNIDINFNEIKANLVEYTKQNEKLDNEINNFEKNISNVLDITVSVVVSNTIKGKNIVNLNSLFADISENDNNTLIVSEKDQVAYLPYKYNEVERFYKNNPDIYSSTQDVIENLYILPLDRFKNSSISRFREGFNLIRHKENGSFLKALDLGLELMFNYDVNPIIIAACRNLDELDIYLDCLEENELSDFKCFEIKFEIAPQKVK